MNLRQLEYFVTLADTEHMTKAATLLNTSQPNLSHAMSELEKELGAALFEKVGRNIRLTKYGRFYYSYVATALNEINKGQQELQNLISPDTGQIDFGYIYTMGAELSPSLTRKFLSIPGNEKINFHFSQGNSQTIIKKLRAADIDIALASKINQTDDIHYQAIAEQKIVLVVNQDHPLADKNQVYLKETSDFPYIYFNQESGLRPYVDELMALQHLQPEIVCEVEEDHSMLGFIGYDFGIGLMPDIPSISAYPVKKIEILDQREPRLIYLATRKGTPLSPVAQRFYDFCLQQNQLHTI
ncbi:LysR family transcriptional regulator [Enterococcus sp. LJL90]